MAFPGHKIDLMSDLANPVLLAGGFPERVVTSQDVPPSFLPDPDLTGGQPVFSWTRGCPQDKLSTVILPAVPLHHPCPHPKQFWGIGGGAHFGAIDDLWHVLCRLCHVSGCVLSLGFRILDPGWGLWSPPVCSILKPDRGTHSCLPLTGPKNIYPEFLPCATSLT